VGRHGLLEVCDTSFSKNIKSDIFSCVYLTPDVRSTGFTVLPNDTVAKTIDNSPEDRVNYWKLLSYVSHR
jgi:hypothetical protein